MAEFTALGGDAAVALDATVTLRAATDAAYVRFVGARTTARLAQHLVHQLDAGASDTSQQRAALLRRQAGALEQAQRAAVTYRFLSFRLARTMNRWQA